MPENHIVCHCCGERRPRNGCKQLGDRIVQICARCWPLIEPAMGSIESFFGVQRQRLAENAANRVKPIVGGPA